MYMCIDRYIVHIYVYRYVYGNIPLSQHVFIYTTRIYIYIHVYIHIYSVGGHSLGQDFRVTIAIQQGLQQEDHDDLVQVSFVSMLVSFVPV